MNAESDAICSRAEITPDGAVHVNVGAATDTTPFGARPVGIPGLSAISTTSRGGVFDAHPPMRHADPYDEVTRNP